MTHDAVHHDGTTCDTTRCTAVAVTERKVQIAVACYCRDCADRWDTADLARRNDQNTHPTRPRYTLDESPTP